MTQTKPVIFLVNPPFKAEFGRFSREQRSPAITKSGTFYFPFWMAYAAGNLDKCNMFDVKVIDAPAKMLTKEIVLDSIKNSAPFMVIVSTSTPSIYSDLDFIKNVKTIVPHAIAAAVGTHVSALAEETLKLCDSLDFVLRREYDETVVDLAKVLNNDGDVSTVTGISYRKNGAITHNRDRELIKDLDSLPLLPEVYHKFLKIEDYFFAAARFPMIMLITGRGCPNGCTYCVYPQTFHSRQYRFSSAERVVKEIELSLKLFPQVREIVFEDDTFTANKERCVAICKSIIEKKINIPWTVNTRVNIDFETMNLMKQAGCRLMVVGFESGSKEILKNIHKGATLEQAEKFMENARKLKLLVHGCFMVGNDGETQSTMKETLTLAKKLNPDTAQFFPLMVYPGTEAYDLAKKNGTIVTDDFSKWVTSEGLHNCVVGTKDLSPEALVAFCNKARKEYYLRPSYILKKVMQSIGSTEERKRIFKAFKRFSKYLWAK